MLFGRIQDDNTLDELSNNTILFENTTLYCMTENRNTPQVSWSYILDGNRSVLSSTIDVTTGVSVLTVPADKPGYYSCEVTRDNGVSRIYSVRMLNSSDLTGMSRLIRCLFKIRIPIGCEFE